MHPHFAFTTAEILWTLTFAAQLVLMVVLLGRERAARFPWFTASVAIITLRVLTGRLLADRLSRLTFAAIMITLADISVVIGILVLVEIARKAFAGAKRSAWIAGAVGLAAAGGVVLRFWGPWPAWSALTGGAYVALQLMQVAAQKGELLVAVLTLGMGLLVALFGRRFGAGWRSHTQRIMIGLSTVAGAQLGVQAMLEALAHHAAPKTRAEYEHVLDLAGRINSANSAIFIAVLVWWIAILWLDEPGTVAVAAAAGPVEVPLSEPENAAHAAGDAETAAEAEAGDQG